MFLLNADNEYCETKSGNDMYIKSDAVEKKLIKLKYKNIDNEIVCEIFDINFLENYARHLFYVSKKYDTNLSHKYYKTISLYRKKFTDDDILIHRDSDAKLKWNSVNTNIEKRNTSMQHNGQLKLALSEIFLLNKIKKDDDKWFNDGKIKNILYIGAAPGTHIPFVMDMFPNTFWLLYDPAKFNVIGNTNHKIFSKLFTEEDTSEIIKKLGNDFIFISDIRHNNKNKYVEEDEKLVNDMLRVMKPRWFMIKRRGIWQKGFMYVPQGIEYYQPFKKYKSAETRIIGKGKNLKFVKVDNVDNESLLFYHNIINRQSIWVNRSSIHRYRRCYCTDCEAAIYIMGGFDNFMNLVHYLGRDIFGAFNGLHK